MKGARSLRGAKARAPLPAGALARASVCSGALRAPAVPVLTKPQRPNELKLEGERCFVGRDAQPVFSRQALRFAGEAPRELWRARSVLITLLPRGRADAGHQPPPLSWQPGARILRPRLLSLRGAGAKPVQCGARPASRLHLHVCPHSASEPAAGAAPGGPGGSLRLQSSRGGTRRHARGRGPSCPSPAGARPRLRHVLGDHSAPGSVPCLRREAARSSAPAPPALPLAAGLPAPLWDKLGRPVSLLPPPLVGLGPGPAPPGALCPQLSQLLPAHSSPLCSGQVPALGLL